MTYDQEQLIQAAIDYTLRQRTDKDEWYVSDQDATAVILEGFFKDAFRIDLNIPMNV